VRQNALRQKLNEGKPAYGTMIQDVRSPSVVQIMAKAGFDFLFIDMEHGPYSYETVANLVRVARLVGITPLVRVPDNLPHLITRVLDLGAQGFMVPRVETRAEVERIVEAALFPPLGKRGCSVHKGQNDFMGQDPVSFTEEANRENLIILQIERQEAVEGIDELLRVPGVGAALIGPNDLSLSLGLRASDMLAALEKPIQRVLDACLDHKIPCGLHISNLDWLVEWQHRGMQLLCYATDILFLQRGASSGVARLREGQEIARLSSGERSLWPMANSIDAETRCS
jgi:2-keto-3-deoxy-L-rhamnonate aldolase RhmA